MDPIAELEAEHRLVLQGLVIWEGLAEETGQGKAVAERIPEAKRLVDFLRFSSTPAITARRSRFSLRRSGPRGDRAKRVRST